MNLGQFNSPEVLKHELGSGKGGKSVLTSNGTLPKLVSKSAHPSLLALASVLLPTHGFVGLLATGPLALAIDSHAVTNYKVVQGA